jgi:hypothetical protein
MVKFGNGKVDNIMRSELNWRFLLYFRVYRTLIYIMIGEVSNWK